MCVIQKNRWENDIDAWIRKKKKTGVIIEDESRCQKTRNYRGALFIHQTECKEQKKNKGRKQIIYIILINKQ